VINRSDNYYTTSSCSGRVLIIIDHKDKKDDLFLFVSHKLVDYKEVVSKLSEIKSKDLIYFKFDPCILHVACRDLEGAQKLFDLATKEAGWKRCGIISSSKRFLVELNSTERLEFPIMNDGKILVSEDFIKLACEEANKKMKMCWDKISRLEKNFKG